MKWRIRKRPLVFPPLSRNLLRNLPLPNHKAFLAVLLPVRIINGTALTMLKISENKSSLLFHLCIVPYFEHTRVRCRIQTKTLINEKYARLSPKNFNLDYAGFLVLELNDFSDHQDIIFVGSMEAPSKAFLLFSCSLIS